MKNLVVILVVTFFSGLGANLYASTLVLDNGTQIVSANDDKKPCPTGCTCADCKAKATTAATTTGASATTTDAKKTGDCSKNCDGKKADAKKSCCSKSTDTKKEATPTDKK
ncbi:MAG: hypothetical protein M0P66_01805 [Salinivirgaceae bacterium]|nr:hypothetical protein [Salinivirgaceae bacterium]